MKNARANEDEPAIMFRWDVDSLVPSLGFSIQPGRGNGALYLVDGSTAKGTPFPDLGQLERGHQTKS